MKIAVVGLGAIGAQALLSLARRPGVEAHGYESGYIGHPLAGAGGEGRLFRNLELTSKGYMPIVQRADELWDELETQGGRRLRRKGGALLLGARHDAQLAHAISVAREFDVAHTLLDAAEIRERFPQFSVSDDHIGAWDEGAGVISPERSIAVAVELAIRAGATAREFAPVQDVEETAGGAAVVLSGGERLEYDRVIVACGGWTTALVPELREWIVTRRLTSVWYAGRSDTSIRGLPPFMQVAPAYCYGIPNEDEQLVKLGLGFNDHKATGDPDSVPRQFTREAAREELERFAWILRDLLPDLDPNPVRLETYIESYTRSMHEFMGVAPDRQHTIVLGGFSGHGFKMAPALGELGADIAVEGKPRLDLDFLGAAETVFSITDVSTGEATRNAVMASDGND